MAINKPWSWMYKALEFADPSQQRSTYHLLTHCPHPSVGWEKESEQQKQEKTLVDQDKDSFTKVKEKG